MTQLDQILALTLRVEQAIENGEWGEANTLESTRRELLVGLFSENAIQDMSPKDQTVLKDLLLRNEESIRNVHTGRREIARRTSQINGATAAARAYQSNAGRPGELQHSGRR